jgi:hypothetical protein
MRSRALQALTVGAIACAITAMSATSAFAVQGGVTPDYGRPTVTIVGQGSDSIYEVMQDLDVLYNRSAGCAIGQSTGFDNWTQECLDPAVYGNAAFAYGGTQITKANWYHDRVVEQFPVGSSAGAKTLNELTKGTTGVNEVQAITMPGAVSGGTFTLGFGPLVGGQTTGAIAWNATAAQVKTALEALSNVQTGEVNTAGGPLDVSPVTVTFLNHLGNADVPQLVSDGTNLTPSQSSQIVTTSTPGVFAPLTSDFVRSSSGSQRTNCTNTTGGVTYTCHGVAFARDGLAVWIGKNNKAVQQSGSAAAPRFYKDNLHDIWVGSTTTSDCLDRYDSSTVSTDDSVATHRTPLSTIAGWTSTNEKAHVNAAGKKDTIVPYATQTSSGSGKDFVILALGVSAAADASPMQGCVPSIFKNNSPSDGEHVIFENNATPICAQPNNTATASKAPGTFNSDQAQAIYPYTFARFTQNGGGAGSCPGVLARISNTAEGTGGFTKPSVASIEDTSATGYPISRQVYNYFQLPSNLGGGFDINTPSTWTTANKGSMSTAAFLQLQAVLYYISPYGFLCQNTSNSATDPSTGINYRTEVEAILHKDGFGAIVSGSSAPDGWTNTSNCRGVTT